jgi:hypothetical protein
MSAILLPNKFLSTALDSKSWRCKMAVGSSFGWQVENSSGVPVSGAKVYFKKSGTSTDQSAYTDKACTIPASNPVEADAAGWFNVYLDANLNYDITIKSADDSVTYYTSTKEGLADTSQPVDATLTALGGLTIADGDIIEGTGADAFRTVKRTVATLSALQALTSSQANDLVYMLDRASAGDGGGGFFRFSTSDLSTEVAADEVTSSEGDGGLYIAPASDKTGASGAWFRQFDGPITSQMYGMAGDGSTDDETQIQRIASLSATYPIALDNGTFLTTSLAGPSGMGRFSGQGIGRSTIKRDSDGGNLFTVNAQDGWQIDNLTLDNDYSTNGDSGHGLVILDCDDWIIGNIEVTNFGNNGGAAGSGIIAYQTSGKGARGLAYNLRADGDTATSTDTNGILFVDQTDMVAYGLYARNIISFGIELKEDSTYNSLATMVVRSCAYGLGYGQSTAGDDGADFNVATGLVAVACDSGVVVGEGDYNAFGTTVVDSTGATGTDVYGVHFSTDATGNAHFGILTHGSNMDYPVRLRGDRNYVSVASHDTAAALATFDSGVSKNFVNVAHPGARTSILGSVINDASGNAANGSSGNVVFSPATGEHRGTISGKYYWQFTPATGSPASLLSSQNVVFENEASTLLTFRSSGTSGYLNGLSVNCPSGANYAYFYYQHSGGGASDFWFLGAGGSANSRIYGSLIRPNADSTVDIGTTSVRYKAGYFDELDAGSFFKFPVYTVAGAPAAGTAGRVIYVSNGDAGSPCLAVDNGANWLRVALGAAISAT